MKRRNFIKSSLILSTTLAAAPSWALNNRIRFGYYYPANKTPETFLRFVKLFKKAGIEADIEDLTSFEPDEAMKKVQQGQYAGLFMSTNLAAQALPHMMLFADGPDAPISEDICEWASFNEVIVDESLEDFNLKRIPFLKVGPRRGIWVNKKISLSENLKDSVVYADGVWAQMMSHHGAQPTQKLGLKSQSPDRLLLSNLFVADEIKLANDYKINLYDTSSIDETHSSYFDLYFNKNYWETLKKSHQDKISHYIIEDGQKMEAFNRAQDERLLQGLLKNPESHLKFTEKDHQLFSKELSQQVRLDYVSRNSSGKSAKKLLDAYMNRFSVTRVNSRKA